MIIVKNHENHIISCEDHENHENHIIQYKKHENHENHLTFNG